jgi:hypothetical protein
VTTLDDAIAKHLARPAMSTEDPLTECACNDEFIARASDDAQTAATKFAAQQADKVYRHGRIVDVVILALACVTLMAWMAGWIA